MSTPLLSLAIREEHDVVAARQRTKHIADSLGFDRIDQTRFATAVSEIARNAFMYASGGRAEYAIEGTTAPQLFVIRIADTGRGIANLDEVLGGRYQSRTGLGVGISGARRLVDRFEIETTQAGTTVTLAKLLPAGAPHYDGAAVGRLVQQLTTRRPEGPLEEVRQQNSELVRALDTLRARQEDLERVNRELEDTNRGVVALYAELDERADHLRRADEIKTRFLSNMTHEFRTPVNSILALSRLLAERLQSGEHEKNELYYIRKSAQQLSDLVDDLLDIAKVEAGKIEVRPTLFEIPALFGALRGMLKPLLVGQSLSLVFTEPGDLPPLYSDETKISQILRNFISNALKYTERGEVRVSAHFRRDDNVMEFSVADTGIGIPEEDLPRIFDEFVQIENPLQRQTKGTGLGLPLSRRLAELLDGTITVSSQFGIGSTFTLTVPIIHRDAPSAFSAPAVPEGLVPVLVVEDSDEDVLVYQRLLANGRFHLVHASTAEAALKLLGAIRPAAVILDIHLHGHDAWDLLVALRRGSETADLPVIVVSAIEDPRKAFGLGASAFGVKPIDRAWLLRTLDTLTEPAPTTRVLAVEDEEAFRFVIREQLNSSRFELVEAKSAREALALAGTFRPHVILVDIQLPDMNGYTLMDGLARNAATKHVPVVVLSSQNVAHHTPAGRPIHHALSKADLTREMLHSAIRDAVRVSPRPTEASQ